MSDPTRTPEGKKQPTASEAMFFYAIVKHTKNRADIDWEGVAQEQGFKNAEVAKVRFGQVKRKLGINDGTTPSGGRSTKKDNHRGDASINSTPTKVRKTPASRAGTKGKKGAKAARADVDEDVKPVKDEALNLDGGVSPSTVKNESQSYGPYTNDPF